MAVPQAAREAAPAIRGEGLVITPWEETVVAIPTRVANDRYCMMMVFDEINSVGYLTKVGNKNGKVA